MFREGLKDARLRLTAERGHYVTPDELGKDVGVSGQTIRNYESGASEPTLDMIEKLARVLGVPLGWPPFGLPSESPSEDGPDDDGGQAGGHFRPRKPPPPLDVGDGNRTKKRRPG